MKIRRLPADLANQIAAGEVVERPASVVKELVENAIDAGASRVRVEIAAGGTELIAVSDDGEGMSRDDAVLALERHATSKITAAEDLFALSTFGFRGEALPSIGSVSRLSLVTRRREDAEGTAVSVDGGGVAAVKPAGASPGTTVSVADLFFNVPARRKFLKSTGTEGAHVGEVVLLAALARPGLTFVLARDGRVAREYLRAASRKERVEQAFAGERLAHVTAERGALRIEALLGPPERGRAGAGGLHLFVNDRPVRDRALARAVAQSYGSVLEAGRYPIGAVYIDLPPALVDVNVHPQKAEVRFQDPRSLFDAIVRELHGSLATAFNLPHTTTPSRAYFFQRKTRPEDDRPAVPAGGPASDGGAPHERHAGPGLEPSAWALADSRGTGPVAGPGAEDGPQGQLFAESRGFYASLRYLGQAKRMFLVCEGDDGLYLLDQHASAERVTFDRLRRGVAQKAIAMQRLLVPEVVSLSASAVATLDAKADDVLSLGLDVRAVGGDAVAVHAVPQLLGRATPEALVRDLAAELEREAGRPFAGAVDLVLATMACHGSLRAGDDVADDEARALLRALDEVDFAGHCPHGRPVVTRLPFSELERRVGR